MGNELHSTWRQILLEEIAEDVTVGHVGAMTDQYIESGIPFLRNKNVDPFKIEWDDMKYVGREFHEKLKKSALSPGDVVIVRTGKPGAAALIPDDLHEANCSDLVIIRSGPEVDRRFLVYYLNSAAKQHIHANLVGAVQQHFNVGAAKKLQVNLPPLPEQKTIAHILGTLDDKIELNRRMNETLESMARALFKSWFVDFDPVIDNALAAGNPIPEPLSQRAQTRRDLGTHHKPLPKNIQKLFPDSFIFDDETGWLPDGWEAEPVGTHVQLQRGKTYKSKLKGEAGPYLLGLGSIGRNGGFRSDKLMTYGGDSPENLLVYPGDLFVSLKDVTQAADLLGAVARVPTSIAVGRMTQDTVKLVFNDGAVSRNILYRTLMTPRYRDFCRGHATGTTNLGLAREDFLGYPVIVPPEKAQNSFDEFMADTESRIDRNERECISLSNLRDTLLPKLLSGELRIPDAEKLVAGSL